MKPEDKEMLLMDLCSRLPYKVIVSIAKGTPNGIIWEDMPLPTYFLEFEDIDYGLEYIKPYLRPISSMTEKEFVYFMGIRGKNLNSYEIQGMMTKYFNNPDGITIVNRLNTYYHNIDWLNKNMFDYRGLIPMGLAIEVTEENNPYK